MPRHDRTTRRTDNRRKNAGHRMHRRGRLVRILAKRGRGRTGMAWGRGAA